MHVVQGAQVLAAGARRMCMAHPLSCAHWCLLDLLLCALLPAENCDNGCYCPPGSSTTCPIDCPKGYYCTNVAGPYPIACAAGQYGSQTSLFSAQCTGSCSAGRFVRRAACCVLGAAICVLRAASCYLRVGQICARVLRACGQLAF